MEENIVRKNILITGGTGLVGSRLTELLLNKGYDVAHLSRTPSDGPIKTYVWDIKKQVMELEAIGWADHIIHLAGAGIADKRWSDSRKEVIVRSRVDSAKLLFKYLQQYENKVESFISASGMSIYGNRGDEWVTEDDPPALNFLGHTAMQWEAAAEQMELLGKRVVKFRTSNVVSSKGGAVPEFKKPMNFGLDVYFGDGEQYYSWVHIDDMCRAYIYAIEHQQMNGSYNVAAPEPLKNKEFVRKMKDALGKKGVFIGAPRISLRIMLGEMADLLLDSIRLSSNKLLADGFKFEYTDLTAALTDVYVYN